MRAPTPRRLLSRLKSIQRQRAGIVKQILRDEPLVAGSVAEIFTRCGRRTCRCARGEKHYVVRLTFKQDGVWRLRQVPPADEKRLLRLGWRARYIRAAIVKLGALYREEASLLRLYVQQKGDRMRMVPWLRKDGTRREKPSPTGRWHLR